jgi:hypothetical protein
MNNPYLISKGQLSHDDQRVCFRSHFSEEGLLPLRQAPNFKVKVKTGLKGADLLAEVADCDAFWFAPKRK